MIENTGFDLYLADQAQLAEHRKRPTPLKRKKTAVKGGGRKTSGQSVSSSSPLKDKLQNRMRKLQRSALRAQPKARAKGEPQAPKPRRKQRVGGEETGSEGSEYLPSDEGMDLEKEEREEIITRRVEHSYNRKVTQ